MKLTETQKKFRKEMQEIGDNRYDSVRTENPFFKASKVSTSVIIIFIFSFSFFAYSVLHKAPTGVSEKSTTSNMVNTNTVIPVSTSLMPNTKLVPIKYVSSLDTLRNTMQPVNDSWAKISAFLNQAPEARPAENYRAALIEGIKVCDNGIANLAKLSPDHDLQPVISASIEYVTYTKSAFKYWLDGSYSQKPSDVTVGNEYSKNANKASANMHNSLIDFFNRNGYSYQVKGGQIEYQYQK